MVDAVIKCLSNNSRSRANSARGGNSQKSCESGCFGGMAQCPARTYSSVATRRLRSIWFNRRCFSSVRAVACETRHMADEQISAQTEWCDRVRKFERSVIQKRLMQFGEEAERITHKYDPRWRTGVRLGRHSAPDAHLIGTPGGDKQV